MGPRVRRFALTAHVVSSVGWLGAVAAFLALAIGGLVSDEPETVRAVYLAMEVVGWWALVPLAVASLVTGLVQSLGTKWGLFRHYWVVTKLLINVLATFVLLLYTETLAYLADAAAGRMAASSALPSTSPILHAGAALLLLLAAAALSIYKPKGLTRYGWRKQQERAVASRA